MTSLRSHLVSLALLLSAACAPTPRPAEAQPPATGLDPRVPALLDELNAFCQRDLSACYAVEGQTYDARPPTPDARRRVDTARAALADLGFELAYTGVEYVIRAESDLQVVMNPRMETIDPGALAEARRRVRARPARYLDVFDGLIMRRVRRDPVVLFYWNPAPLLELLEGVRPPRVLALATEILAGYDLLRSGTVRPASLHAPHDGFELGRRRDALARWIAAR